MDFSLENPGFSAAADMDPSELPESAGQPNHLVLDRPPLCLLWETLLDKAARSATGG